MTQIKEKTIPANLDADEDRAKEETALEEIVKEELAGVHILGKEDMAKHFPRSTRKSPGKKPGSEANDVG